MKNILQIGSLILLLMITAPLIAQKSGKENKKPDKKEVATTPEQAQDKGKSSEAKARQAEADENKPRMNESVSDSVKPMQPSKGKAYGKQKGNMEGRAFGKLRSQEARSRVNKQNRGLTEEIENSEEAVKIREERLVEAKNKLEEQKANGEITEEEAAQKEESLAKVEKRLATLKENIRRKKEMAEATEMDEKEKTEVEEEVKEKD